MSNLVFLTSYTLPLWVAVGLVLGPEYLWMTVVNLYVLHPIFDFLIERYIPNTKKQNAFIQSKLGDKFSRFILVFYPVIQLALVIGSLLKISTLDTVNFEFISLIVATGVMTGGAGLTMAHELMHGKSKLYKVASLALMWMCSYPHWFIEHVLGHHKMVGTFEDPATSRKNETLYAFIPRSILGQFKSSYNLKTEQFLKLWLVQLGVYATILIAFNLQTLIFFIAQSIVAVILLEQVNYIEHYGLERAKVNGKYQKVTPAHSWDCYSFLTNVSMFNLGFHADHHAHINKEYTDLKSHEASNKMPYGFTIQMLMAMVPSLWFKTMNPILENNKNNENHFTKSLISELQTEIIQSKYEHLIPAITTQNLFRYLKFTQVLEIEVINKFVGQLIEQGIDHHLLAEMPLSQSLQLVKKAKQIFKEEEEHADSVIAILEDVKTRSNQACLTLDRPQTLEILIEELNSIDNARIFDLTLFAFVFTSETLISHKLSTLAKDKSIYSPISEFMLHHLKDEVKHGHYFGEFLVDMFPTLSRKEQSYLLSKIEEYKALFLTVDVKSIGHELTNLGVDHNDQLTCLKEIEAQISEKDYTKECEATNRYIKIACRSAHYVQLQVIS